MDAFTFALTYHENFVRVKVAPAQNAVERAEKVRKLRNVLADTQKEAGSLKKYISQSPIDGEAYKIYKDAKEFLLRVCELIEYEIHYCEGLNIGEMRELIDKLSDAYHDIKSVKTDVSIEKDVNYSLQNISIYEEKFKNSETSGDFCSIEKRFLHKELLPELERFKKLFNELK